MRRAVDETHASALTSALQGRAYACAAPLTDTRRLRGRCIEFSCANSSRSLDLFTMPVSPDPGDVLITSKDGRHYLSVVPNRALGSFRSLSQAREFAQRWARDHSGASIWHETDGTIRMIDVASSSLRRLA